MTYNGSLTREQFMFKEMRIVAKLLSEGMSDDDVLKCVAEENLFQYPTEREIKSKCGACLKRLKCVEDMPVISQAIGFGTLGEAKQAVLISMMCQNQLVADFMICVIGDKYRNLDMTITRKDMNVFFQNLAQSNETVAGWSDNTIKKIKTVLRGCLAEAEYISDARSEVLQPVMISGEFEDELKRAGHRGFLPAFNVLD